MMAAAEPPFAAVYEEAAALHRLVESQRAAGRPVAKATAERLAVLTAGLAAVTSRQATTIGDRTRQDLATALKAWFGAPMALLLKPAETAGLLAMSGRTLQRITAEGQLPAVKVGGSTRYRRADVADYVASLGSEDAAATPAAQLAAPPVGRRSASRTGDAA